MVSGLAIVGKRLVNKEGYRPHEKAVGGGSVSAAHCFFITLFRFSRVAAAPEGSSDYRLPLSLLLFQHLINSVFPDNEDRAMIEKFLKQRLVGQNLFVLLAAAL